MVDSVYLFRTDPQTSLNRENEDKLVDDLGSAMNPDTLEQLNSAYAKVRDVHGNRFKDLYEIDTRKGQNTTPKSTAYEVTRSMVDQMKKAT